MNNIKRFKSDAAEALPSFLPMIGELRSLLKNHRLCAA